MTSQTKPRVLVVEDDTITRYMMTEMCDELGYACETVAGGQECIELVDREPDRFGIIMMDIHMPRVSGLDAKVHIRASENDPPRGLPIVAVTADEHWHNPHRCREAGFNDVLPKPVTLNALRETFQRYLN